MLGSQAQGAHMEVADERQLLGRVSRRRGLQGRQLIAAEHAGLRNEEDAALAVLYQCTAGLMLPTHWHLHIAMSLRLQSAKLLGAMIFSIFMLRPCTL